MMPETSVIRSVAREAACQIARRPIKDEQRLVSSGLIDSLSILRLIALLEDRLSVSIPPETLQPEDFDTVELIVETVGRVGRFTT
jgi:acyl carrier protein